MKSRTVILLISMLNIPKNDSKYHWTNHAIRKMVFYGLSLDRVKRVVRNPKRVEEGVAENTTAVMQPGTNKKKPSEIWVMYSLSKKASTLSERAESKGNNMKSFDGFDKLTVVRNSNHKLRTLDNNFSGRKIIISAWRYPGVSPVGKRIPIPDDILEELERSGVM